MTTDSMYLFAEKENIEVDWFMLGRAASLSAVLPDGGVVIAIDPTKLENEADHRTKLGHELGHCSTGSFYNQYTPFDVVEKHEHRADRWEIEHLIPRGELQEALKDGRTQPWELAEYFGVTEGLIRKALCLYSRGTLDVESECGVAV